MGTPREMILDLGVPFRSKMFQDMNQRTNDTKIWIKNSFHHHHSELISSSLLNRPHKSNCRNSNERHAAVAMLGEHPVSSYTFIFMNSSLSLDKTNKKILRIFLFFLQIKKKLQKISLISFILTHVF